VLGDKEIIMKLLAYLIGRAVRGRPQELPGVLCGDNVVLYWRLVDPDNADCGAEARYTQAQAMAAGLNAAAGAVA
jgi:type II secretory pathway component PulM